ncbi:hypothetical protein D1872_287400 [compost metagenome]
MLSIHKPGVFRQADYRVLGSDIRGACMRTAKAPRRCRVYNDTATFLQEDRDRFANRAHHGFRVDVEDQIPFFVFHIPYRGHVIHNSCIVNQDIQRTELVDSRIDHLVDLVKIGYIGS